MRLIDADELKKEAYPFPCAIGVEYAVTLRRINEAPTIDAEPVRHGRWIQAKTAPSYHYCSYCKSTHKMTMSCNKYVLLKYCPDCGAKMDGEDNNGRS